MNRGERPSFFLFGIFLISTTTLALEISLSRYFAITRNYHFAFLVVSIAFLGYGISGSCLASFRKWLFQNYDLWRSRAALLYSLTILVCFIISNGLSFDLIELTWSPRKIFLFPLLYFLLAIPFFFAGTIISLTVAQFPEAIARVYFADLSGAALGTFLSLGLFSIKGDRGVFPLLALLPLGATFFFISKKQKITIIGSALGIIFGLILLAWTPNFLEFRLSPYKPLKVALRHPGARILATKWNALSRVDLIKSPAVRYAPGLALFYENPLPPQVGISIDGQQISAITFFSGHPEKQKNLAFLDHLPHSFIYKIKLFPQVLLINPRAGLDLISAYFHQAASITAIEDNPLIIQLLQSHLPIFSNFLYQQPRIKLLVKHPRAALSQLKKQFQVIIFPFTDIFGAAATGLFGFRENYLYTQEAFHQNLNLLSSDGWIVQSFYLLPPPRQELRALATWIEVLEADGRFPQHHLLLLRTWGTLTLFIKKSPIHKKEINAFKNFSEENSFDLVYYPGISPQEANRNNQFPEPIYFRYTQSLLSFQRDKFLQEYLFNLKPPTDDSPFFFNFFKWSRLKETYQAFGQKWLPFLEGEGAVPFTLFQAAIIAGLFILLPFLFSSSRKSNLRTSHVFGYFYLIGMSFMFIEITAIQKFILFLEHPVYSLAAILFMLLISTGIGSFFSLKIERKWPKLSPQKMLFGLSLLEFSYLFWIKLLFSQGIHLAPIIKFCLAGITLFPLGFFMGLPFPLGIHQLKNFSPQKIAWAWAVNSFSSVINSILAIFLAFFIGYRGVWFLGGMGYLGAAFLLNFSHHWHKTNS